MPALYLVLAGEAEILVTIDGQSRLVGSSRRGELLGETTMLVAERSGATATVRTLQGMELLEIQKVDLMTLLQQDPAMTARFYRAISCMLSQRSRDQLLSHQLATTSRQAEVNSGSDQLNLERAERSRGTSGSTWQGECPATPQPSRCASWPPPG